MATLAPIRDSNETIALKYSYSLNMALTQLAQESSVDPIIRSPYGGARTKAECIAMGLHWSISDHYQDAGSSAAVDIWNWEAIQGVIGTSRFKEILSDWGWHNVTTDGKPFPKEPWHYANQDNTPRQPSTGGSGTLINNQRKKRMVFIAIKNAAGALIQWQLINTATGKTHETAKQSTANKWAKALGYGAQIVTADEQKEILFTIRATV